MKLVVGLGNPGRKYHQTRHNVGFDVVARLAEQHSVGRVQSKFHGEMTDFQAAGDKVLLLRPLTYMNRSGTSVQAACDFFKLPLDRLLVVCDDFNLPLGKLRFRPHGSAGGQKGLQHIIRQLGSDQFARLRVGIGPPPEGWNVADYVLSRFHQEEREVVATTIQRAARGVLDWVEHDVSFCMNQYNGP
jgi:PTH1 family peptidyl-tRNA hydrolase